MHAGRKRNTSITQEKKEGSDKLAAVICFSLLLDQPSILLPSTSTQAVKLTFLQISFPPKNKTKQNCVSGFFFMFHVYCGPLAVTLQFSRSLWPTIWELLIRYLCYSAIHAQMVVRGKIIERNLKIEPVIGEYS